MNRDSTQTRVFGQKVELLLRLLPIVMEEGVFAVHGGSAINLFLRNLPRYSVDIDLTYIPLAERQESIDDINRHLKNIADKAKRVFRGMHVIPNTATASVIIILFIPAIVFLFLCTLDATRTFKSCS